MAANDKVTPGPITDKPETPPPPPPPPRVPEPNPIDDIVNTVIEDVGAYTRITIPDVIKGPGT